MTATVTLAIFVLAASAQTTSTTQSMTGSTTTTTNTSGEASRKGAAEKTTSSTKAPSKVTASTRNDTETKKSTSKAAATTTTTTEAEADSLTTTKLSFEVEKLGKFNVEGLSRRALLWMVMLVIVAVLIAGIAGKRVAESSSSSAPIVTLGVVAAIAGLAVFFVMRSRLAPLRDVETTAVSLRDSVQSATWLVARLERRIRQLETALTEANSRIAELPTIEAELLIERDRLAERERKLTGAAAEEQAVRDQLKATTAIAEEQREQLLRMRYVRTAMWLTWSVLVLAILAGYHVLLWRSRRIPYAHIEDIVEHYLRRRGPM